MRTFSILILVAALAGKASAAPPTAPIWMPNAPILAGTQVILLWLPVPNAVKYNVYLDGAKIGESQAVQHIVTAPTAPGEHKIEVSAVGADGAEGPRSLPGVVRIISIEPPASVYGRSSESTIQLRWDTAKGAVIYNVYRAEKAGGEPKLLASVQGDSYTDSQVHVGKSYIYYVTSKDLAGKESRKSQPTTIEIAKAVVQQAAVRIAMKIVPTKAVTQSALIGKDKVAMYSDMKLGPDGFLYLVDSGKGNILKISAETLDIVKTFGGKGNEPGQFVRPLRIAVTDDGLVYCLDYGAKKVVVFTTDGAFKFEFPIGKPEDKTVLANVPPQFNVPGTHEPNSIAVDTREKVVYISDTRFNTIYRYSLDGKLLGFLGHGGDPEKNLAAPTELLVGNPGELYVTEPLAHLIVVLDTKTGAFKRVIGKKATGFIGGFIGINGLSKDPSGNIVASDSGVHSIQVFDGKTGDYLYHFGDESGKPDAEVADRASLGIQLPVGTAVGKNGRLYIFRGDRSQIQEREIIRK